MATVENVLNQARLWLGKNERDGSHREIIDVYNSQKPLPVGYRLKYTDAWCAGFVSALAQKLGMAGEAPTECSVPRMIEKAKKMSLWIEDDAHRPTPGEWIVFDWRDSGAGDDTNGASHVGIVESVVGNDITTIEGNYQDSVKRRVLAVNGRYIRGYVHIPYDAPAYADKTVNELATEVIQGKWGSGQERVDRLTAAGYDYQDVQAEVNRILTNHGKSISELATEVIQGKWGSDPKRSKALTAAGYDAKAVQAEVNRRLRG